MKQRFSICYSPERDLVSLLDAVKVSDIVIFITNIDDSEEACCDNLGDITMSCIRNIGVSGLCGWIQCIKHNKNENEMTKYGKRLLETEFGNGIKIINQNKQYQITLTLSTLSTTPLGFRKLRSYLLGDNINIVNNNKEMEISGYLRGSLLYLYSIIHITGVGNFNIKSVEKMNDPYSRNNRKSGGGSSSGEEESNGKIYIADESQYPSLNSLNKKENDDEYDMENEQTWPTVEELMEADKERKKLEKERLQEEYLYPEEVSESENENDEENENENDDEIDNEEEKKKKLEKRKEEEQNERDFADEVDTPSDIPARYRFMKYRGLESMRSSEWDPKENLPKEYNHLFEFENFIETEKRILNENEKLYNNLVYGGIFANNGKKDEKKSNGSGSGSEMMEIDNEEEVEVEESELEKNYISPNCYVRITLLINNNETIEKLKKLNVLILSSLFEHEEKMSVIHCRIQRNAVLNMNINNNNSTTNPANKNGLLFYNDPVKSKDLMEIHNGFRREKCKPIFSENNLNSDKHKFIRYLNDNGYYICTYYGYISFQPCPVLLFHLNEDGNVYYIIFIIYYFYYTIG